MSRDEQGESSGLPAGKPSVGDGAKAKESQGMAEWLASAWRRGWPFGLLLVAAVMIAYHPAWHGGFIWDDDDYVTENPLLTVPDGLQRIWLSLDSPSQYFPLTYTTFYLERGLWGLNPAGYHWVNLLLHAANALLVWRVLRRLRVPGAWLAAAVFALHPVQVESVAWITERKNVLMGFFFLLTLWAWIKFIEDPGKRRWRFYALALVLYALALSAKTTACTLPAALLLILWLRQMPINWRRLAQVGPFMALAIGMGLVTVWWERYHQGTQGKLFEIGPVERVLIASRALWFYAGKLVWPANLTFSYPHWTISASDPRAYGWVLATAALGVAIWRARRRAGRGVEVAAAYFAVTLSPVLGFIMLYTFRYSFVADHYQYLACIGPIALAAAGIAGGIRSLESKAQSPESKVQSLKSPSPQPSPHPMGRGGGFLYATVCGALVVALGALTWRQAGMYTDLETLWVTTLARNPRASIAHNNLGKLLLQRGREDDAIAHFQEALAIQPNEADAHSNLGGALGQKGRVDEGIVHFQKALELDPNYAEAYYNLGGALGQKGRLDEAISCYQKALRIRPRVPETHYNLAKVLAQKGSLTEAITHYQKALQIRPGYAEAHSSLGIALFQQGRVDEATAHFRSALQLQPKDANAHCNLGIALLQKGNLDDAMALFSKASTLDPESEPAHYNLGNVCMIKGKLPAAIAELKTATRLKPDHTEPQKKLADALLKTGKAAEAIPYCEAVVKAEPKDAHAHFVLGSACLEGKRPEQAVASYKEALRLAPDVPECMNALAWIYATCPKAELRNGAEAVRLAERACVLTKRQKTAMLDTLAAAYAEAGRFDDAVKIAEEIRALAVLAHDTNTADTARQRLALYQAGKPYRDEP